MLLKDATDVLGIVDEAKLREIHGDIIDKLIEIKAFAILGFDGDSNYWGVVNGQVLKWCYPNHYIKASLKLLEILDRNYTFWILPLSVETEGSPLIIKIEKYGIDKYQKYLLIAPRIEEIEVS